VNVVEEDFVFVGDGAVAVLVYIYAFERIAVAVVSLLVNPE